MKCFFLLVVQGDVEPYLYGPFIGTDEKHAEQRRDDFAREYRREHGDEDGLFALERDTEKGPTTDLRVDSFSAAFFEEDEAEAGKEK